MTQATISTHSALSRRDFCATTAAIASTAFIAPLSWAQNAANFEKKYRRLDKPAEVQAMGGKIEVVEFFWYSCGHCYAFEPQFAAWKKQAPAHIHVRRVPVAFNASFIPQQKLFFAIEHLENFEVLHATAFHAIHVEKNRLNTDDLIFAWAKKQKLDFAQFEKNYRSFTTANAARAATHLQNAYGVDGVPSLGVAGRYYTDGELAGSIGQALQTVEYLVEKTRKG